MGFILQPSLSLWQKTGESAQDLARKYLPWFFPSQHGRQGDAGDTGIRNEAQDLINQGKEEGKDISMEQALEQIRKDAKANKDKQKLQKVKSEEKYQEIRRSRNKKDKK